MSMDLVGVKGVVQKHQGFVWRNQIETLPPPQCQSFFEWWRVGAADQSNRLAGGGPRGCTSRCSVAAACLSRWVSLLSMSTGSSMQARIVTAPPQLEQVSMSIWNTRFSRCAQVIAARRCADDELCPCSSKRRLRPLPRFAGVILMRCLLQSTP